MKKKQALILGLLLALSTFAVYWPVAQHQFIDYDDQDYVTENPMVQSGLTWGGVKWAFTTGHAGNWHPLAWVSHMLDCQFYGLQAGGHHLTSLLFHTANTVLLFLLLRRLTGALWRSALVAALFGLHPLHVESVAWVAERKDVLSAFFFTLTLLAYAKYVSRVEGRGEGQPKVQSPKSKVSEAGPAPRTPHPASLWYALSLLLFALGLLSKPMLVTLPFVLLLLDYWPLRRFSLSAPLPASIPGQPEAPQTEPPSSRLSSRFLPLVWEKIPFFLLSAASSVVTFIVQRQSGAVVGVHILPVEARIENACFSYGLYLWKMLKPSGLAPFYPYAAQSLELVLLVMLFLVVCSAAALALLKRAPYVAVGWFWYLGTLVPVIGLVQVGQQSLADRYTYLPLIGIFVVAAWGAGELARRWRWGSLIATVSTGAALSACVVLTVLQVARWQGSETLFGYTLRVTANNHIAHQNLGAVLVEQGKIAEATPHFAEAVRISPTFAEAQGDYGLALVYQGKIEEGIKHYRAALAVQPALAKTHYSLGRALEMQGKKAEALPEYTEAVKLSPGFKEARHALALALAGQQRFAEASVEFAELLRLSPQDADLHFNLGSALKAQGRIDEAAAQFTEAVRLKPEDAESQENLGFVLGAKGELAEAVNHLRESVRLRPTAQAHYELGLALGMQGERKQALEQYREALRLQPNWPAALNDLAWLLATAPEAELRHGPEAVQLARKATELSDGKEGRFWGTLDAAYAEAGQFQAALEAAAKARELFLAANQADLAQAAEKRMELYRSGKPFHQ